MRYRVRVATILLLPMLLAACASSGTGVEQKLDPLTSVTVRRAMQPAIFYRDDFAYAAHARNFVYVGPIEVNRMGNYDYFLWFGVWNTIRDDERLALDRDGFESVVLLVDGTPLPLELAGWTFDRVGVSEPVYTKPVAGASDAYYRVTMDQIRMLARATDVELHVGAGGSTTYVPWDGPNATRDTFEAFALRGFN